MLLGARGEGGGGGIETVLPSSAELFFGAIMFALVIAAIAAVVFLLIGRRSSDSELEEWRERALRAEAERDLLRDLKSNGSSDSVR